MRRNCLLAIAMGSRTCTGRNPTCAGFSAAAAGEGRGLGKPGPRSRPFDKFSLDDCAGCLQTSAAAGAPR